MMSTPCMSCGQPRERPAPELCRHKRNHYPNLRAEQEGT